MHPKGVKSPCPYSDMLVSASSETMRGTQDVQEAHLESLKVAHHSPCLSGACWGLSGSPRETTSVKHYWFRSAATVAKGWLSTFKTLRSFHAQHWGGGMSDIFVSVLYKHLQPQFKKLAGFFHRRTQWASGAEVHCESLRQTVSAVGSRFYSPSHPHILFSQPT